MKTALIVGAFITLATVTNPALAQNATHRERGSDNTRIVAEFQDRVHLYLAAHRFGDVVQDEQFGADLLLEEMCMPKIFSGNDEFSTSVRREIFTPELDELFRRTIFVVLSPFEQAAILRMMPQFSTGRVPVHRVSPDLMRALPTLPPRLQYCFIGHDLVIFDLHLNVVVDSLPLVIGSNAT